MANSEQNTNRNTRNSKEPPAMPDTDPTAATIMAATIMAAMACGQARAAPGATVTAAHTPDGREVRVQATPAMNADEPDIIEFDILVADGDGGLHGVLCHAARSTATGTDPQWRQLMDDIRNVARHSPTPPSSHEPQHLAGKAALHAALSAEADRPRQTCTFELTHGDRRVEVYCRGRSNNGTPDWRIGNAKQMGSPADAIARAWAQLTDRDGAGGDDRTTTVTYAEVPTHLSGRRQPMR